LENGTAADLAAGIAAVEAVDAARRSAERGGAKEAVRMNNQNKEFIG
jgi:hypothetical protein